MDAKEAKQKWISDKISKIHADNPKIDPKQAVAIAYSMWRDKHKK